MDVLDLGCGDGLTGLALAKRGCKNPDLLTGVDFSHAMLNVAQQRLVRLASSKI